MIDNIQVEKEPECKLFIYEDFIKSNEKSVDLSMYTHIRAYHACRPIDIESYMINGIKAIGRKLALEDALKRIKAAYITEDDIKKMFNKEWKNVDVSDKKVWLAVNREILITDSGHYLIYGSEFTNMLSMELGCRDMLKNIGIPTIFICDVPLQDIECSWLSAVEQAINRCSDDISIYVDAVRPENIIECEHPKEIPDPYYGFSKYKPNYSKLHMENKRAEIL